MLPLDIHNQGYPVRACRRAQAPGSNRCQTTGTTTRTDPRRSAVTDTNLETVPS
jgi:hypothetical protein